jgi:predicted nucleic acid-binding protein
MLYRAVGDKAQTALWDLRDSGRLSIHVSRENEMVHMAALMKKYHDLPMDLADASILGAAEEPGTRRVFTLDQDFRVYRFTDAAPVEVVP